MNGHLPDFAKEKKYPDLYKHVCRHGQYRPVRENSLREYPGFIFLFTLYVLLSHLSGHNYDQAITHQPVCFTSPLGYWFFSLSYSFSLTYVCYVPD